MRCGLMQRLEETVRLELSRATVVQVTSIRTQNTDPTPVHQTPKNKH